MILALRRALAMLPPALRWGWLAIGVLAAAAAGAEAVGAGAVFLLVKILSDPGAIAAGGGLPIPLPEWLAAADERSLLLRSTEIIALFYVLKNVFQGLVVYLQNRLTGASIFQLSRYALDLYLAAPFGFHLRRRSADVMHNATAGTARVAENVLAPAMAIFSEALVASGIVVVLLLASPGLTLVTLALLGALAFASVAASRRFLVRLGEREHAARQGALATVQQALGGLREVRVMGAAEHFRRRFGRSQRELARVRAAVGTLAFLPRLVIETIFIVATLAVVWLVGRSAGGGDLVPLLGLYAYAGFRLIPTCNRIVMHLGSLRFGAPTVAALAADLAPLAAAGRREAAGSAGFGFRRELRCEGVSFSYPGAERPALAELDLTIEAGEAVAIVGETGSGKSTLVDLVLGLLEPSAGRILVDGVDLSDVVPAWQSRIGYVPQSIFLLDDSLRRNVAFGVPDERIDEQRVERALRDAGLASFAAGLEAGLETELGENGVNLSGGQRQLVAIARALYRDPDVLIFDEATSSLDGATEREVSAAIGALGGERTLVVVTHRLESVRGFDRLVVLAEGRKVAEGTFESLASECAELRRLAGGRAGGA